MTDKAFHFKKKYPDTKISKQSGTWDSSLPLIDNLRAGATLRLKRGMLVFLLLPTVSQRRRPAFFRTLLNWFSML
jgi:hypothetical protein